ncbi:MAG: hypothetical protein JNL18_08460 [Planctomycetaceae bacterium]|nr:hypothetical protein [Planctomycetaceae bacterium]
MRFDIHFTRGPLDGLRLDGDTSDADADGEFASECFRRSGAGLVGTRFETLDPRLSASSDPEPTEVKLHQYEVESATSYCVSSGSALVPVHIEVKAVYQGSSIHSASLDEWLLP